MPSSVRRFSTCTARTNAERLVGRTAVSRAAGRPRQSMCATTDDDDDDEQVFEGGGAADSFELGEVSGRCGGCSLPAPQSCTHVTSV